MININFVYGGGGGGLEAVVVGVMLVVTKCLSRCNSLVDAPDRAITMSGCVLS